MNKQELLRRYIFFVVAILVNSFAIAVITKALLGTSPISSVPLALSYCSRPTLGQWTVYFNLLFIVFDILLMGWKETKRRWYELAAQVPISLCFGLFIDVSMNCLLFWLAPQNYVLQVVTLIIGCILLGAGVSMEVKANVAMVAGEYLVNCLSKRLHKDFGLVKVVFDWSNVALAALLGWVFLGHIVGIREGTLVAAFLVGPISHIIYPWLSIFDPLLTPEKQGTTQADTSTAGKPYPVVITIAREFGSGGHLVGAQLAKQLGLPFYDKALISMAAEEASVSEEYVSKNEQRMSANRLLNIILRDYGAPITESLTPADAVFVAQSRVIRRLAEQESCVILGRLADYVLKDRPAGSLIRVFCHTDVDDAFRRCTQEYGLDPQSAHAAIEQANRQRISHYQYYTGQTWGDARNYDLTIHTGRMGIEVACDLIAQLYRQKKTSGTASAQ